MLLSANDYINFSALAYVNFSSLDKNDKISDIIRKVLNGESRPGLDLSTPELFALADENNPLRNWQLISFQPNTASGFAGAAFRDPLTGRIVFSFRGTEVSGSGSLKHIIEKAYPVNV